MFHCFVFWKIAIEDSIKQVDDDDDDIDDVLVNALKGMSCAVDLDEADPDDDDDGSMDDDGL